MEKTNEETQQHQEVNNQLEQVGNEQQPPIPQGEDMMTPEVAAFFKKYPEFENAKSLEISEKKEFIKNYYTEDFDMEKAINDGLLKAAEIIDAEIQAGRGQHPFSEPLVIGLIELSKLKSIDDLIQEVTKIYAERREQVKGLEITDPKVLEITQQHMAKMAFIVQQNLALKIEQEVEARELPINQLMPIIINYIMGDLSFFVDIEKFYNLRKVQENANVPCELEKLQAYISESIEISKLILEGKVAQGNLFLFPHMLSDRLYNQTGYESEQIVFYIRQLNEKNELDEETVNLIVEESYSVEKSKKECFSKFDQQMMQMEQQFMQEMEEAELRKIEMMKQSGGSSPFDDKGLMKLAQMGLSIPGLNVPGSQGMPPMPGMGGMPGMPGMGMPGMGNIPGMGGIPGTKKGKRAQKKKL